MSDTQNSGSATGSARIVTVLPVLRPIRRFLVVPARQFLATRVIGSVFVHSRVRFVLMRLIGYRFERCMLYDGIVWRGTGRVHIGRGAGIGCRAVIDHAATVTIGPRAGIGPEAMILTASHPIAADDGWRWRTSSRAPVTIGGGAWLGARVIVLPGVTIGAGAVVAAGAVVTRDCRPNALYGGVPARLIKVLEDPGTDHDGPDPETGATSTIVRP